MAYSFSAVDTCGYCAWLRGAGDGSVVAESEFAAVVVPPWMRTRGAVIALPKAHARSFLDLGDREAADLFALAQRAAAGIVAAFDPDGLHFWWDTGLFVGQTEPHHIVEVVPRYADHPYRFQPVAELPRRAGSELAEVVLRLRDALAPVPSGGGGRAA